MLMHYEITFSFVIRKSYSLKVLEIWENEKMVKRVNKIASKEN